MSRIGRRPDGYTLVVIFVSSMLTSLVAVLLAVHAVQLSERKFCTLVTTMDAAYREEPPQTPTGKNLAQAIADLRQELNC